MLHPQHKRLCQLSELLKAYRDVYVDVRMTVYVTYSNDSNFHTPSLFPPFEPESSVCLSHAIFRITDGLGLANRGVTHIRRKYLWFMCHLFVGHYSFRVIRGTFSLK